MPITENTFEKFAKKAVCSPYGTRNGHVEGVYPYRV